MGKFAAALLILLAVVGPGCGGNNQSESQADCHTFIETSYCPKVVACYTGQIDQSGCVSVALMGLDCAKVIGENAEPKTCMDDISSATCRLRGQQRHQHRAADVVPRPVPAQRTLASVTMVGRACLMGR